MAEEGVANAKKKALKEGRILVFIDESGLSQGPHRCRTWAPRGQTPILQYNFNWKTLSVAAGLTSWKKRELKKWIDKVASIRMLAKGQF